MSEDQSGTPTLRRRVLQSSSTLLFALAGCNSSRSDRQPTSTPTKTEPPTATRSKTERNASEQPGVSSVSSSEYLTGVGEDGAETIRTMIEEVATSGPGRIHWDSGTVVVKQTIAPETDGTEVVIEGNNEVVIDGTEFDGPILNLGSAPNVSLRRLTIKGSPGDRTARSVLAGEGSTLRDIVLDGGAGGLDIRNSDVTVDTLEAYGHRDTTNGYAAGIHVGGDIEDIRISDIDVRNCDRGVEIDDGPSRWTVERGSIRQIDNSQAEDPGVPFALDCHVHAGEAPISDGTFRDILVENCQRGFTISEHEEGLVSGITARDIQVKHIRSGAHVLCEAEVELVNPTVVAGKDNENWGIFVRGGALEVNGGYVSIPGGSALTIREGGRTPLKTVQFDGLTITGEESPGTPSPAEDVHGDGTSMS